MDHATATLKSEGGLRKGSLFRLITKCVRLFGPPFVRLSGAGIQFLSTILIARQLGDEKSATFFFWSAMLTSLAPVATYGMEHIVIRTVPRLHDDRSAKKLRRFLATIRMFVLGMSVVIGVGLLVYAVLRNGTDSHGFQMWHLLLPVSLFAISMTLINGEALKGLSRPVAGIFFGHFIPVSLFCLLILVNLDRLSSPLLVVVYTIAYAAAMLAMRFGPSKTLRKRQFEMPNSVEGKAIRKEGFPVFTMNALGALCYVAPLMLLDFLRPSEEVAYVTTAFRISILFAILAAAIHGVFAPQLSRAGAIHGNRKEIFKVYGKAMATALLTLAIPIGVGIANPEWVMAIFGEEFRPGAETLRILLISGALALLLGPSQQLMLMTGNTRLLAILGSVKLFIAVTLSLLLIPQFGGVGMVIAMGVAFLLEEIVGLICVVFQLKRQFNGEASEP